MQFDLDTWTAVEEGEGGEGGDKRVLKLQKIDKGRIFARMRSAVLLGGVHVVWQR